MNSETSIFSFSSEYKKFSLLPNPQKAIAFLFFRFFIVTSL